MSSEHEREPTAAPAPAGAADAPGANNPFTHITQWTAASSTVTLEDDSTRANTANSERACAPGPPDAPVWTHRLSASFSAVAEQIAAASRALALVPPNAALVAPGAGDVEALNTRLDAIETRQSSLAAELEALRASFAVLDTPGASTSATDDLAKKLQDLADIVKLDQTRLYTRLLNSTASVSKMPIKAPPMANGKTPSNFPATKGEFEHVTKERYEAILKAYDLPTKGDISAKRETLRAFLGLPA